MKGYASRILKREFPELRRRFPALWTRSSGLEFRLYPKKGQEERLLETLELCGRSATTF